MTFGFCPFFPFFLHSSPQSRGKGLEPVSALSPASWGWGSGQHHPRDPNTLRALGGSVPASRHPQLLLPAVPVLVTFSFSSQELPAPRDASGGFVWQSLGKDEPGGYWEHPRLQLYFPIKFKLKNSINSPHRSNHLTGIWGKLSPSLSC